MWCPTLHIVMGRTSDNMGDKRVFCEWVDVGKQWLFREWVDLGCEWSYRLSRRVIVGIERSIIWDGMGLKWIRVAHV